MSTPTLLTDPRVGRELCRRIAARDRTARRHPSRASLLQRLFKPHARREHVCRISRREIIISNPAH